jgi:bifunctional non-homologous end joining protein LigD
MKSLLPMNAHAGTAATLKDSRYVFEPKLDGYRALCYVNDELTFISRNGIDITSDYPEFNFRKHIKAKNCILDGEIVVFNDKGVPDFSLLQQGFKEAVFVVFDILAKNGESLLDVPLKERKKILEATVKSNKSVERLSYSLDGPKLYKFVNKHHLEGIMAKELDSPYYANKRSRAWLKIKTHKSLDAIIVGYTTSKRAVSSLALALYDDKNKLHYIGKVGTGFNDLELLALAEVFKELKTTEPDIQSPVAVKGIHWIKPTLVGEIKYQAVTRDKQLRIPVFVRLRADKNAQDCRYDQLKVVKKK